MERNTVTTMRELETGDRFYKCADKKKTVYEKVKHETTKTKYQTYQYWAMEGSVLQTSANIERFAKAITGSTEVVFLRHKELAVQ